MLGMILLLLLLAQEAPFRYSSWDSWSSFGEGSWARYSIRTRGTQFSARTLLQSKEGDALVLKLNNRTSPMDGERETPATTTRVRKSDANACPQCRKEHKSEPKEEKETVETADRKFACIVVSDGIYDCTGRSIGQIKTWFSKEVPGWIVKMESTKDGVKVRLLLIEFEVK